MNAAEKKARWTQFQHGHLGVECVKEVQMSSGGKRMNKTATCTKIDRPAHGMSFEGYWKWQVAKLAGPEGLEPPSSE